jgi:hypothetical protein
MHRPTVPSLRPWAYLEAMVVCLLIAVVCITRLAIEGPSVTLASILSGDLLALLTLAGLRPTWRWRPDRRKGRTKAEATRRASQPDEKTPG